jgi:hypothetical protein
MVNDTDCNILMISKQVHYLWTANFKKFSGKEWEIFVVIYSFSRIYNRKFK